MSEKFVYQYRNENMKHKRQNHKLNRENQYKIYN